MNQTDSSALVIPAVIGAVIGLFLIVAMWKVFAKAGKPGWAAIIPLYNIYVQLKIVGRPGWWLILFFIPVVNIVISLLVAIDMAKSFGKGSGFGVVGQVLRLMALALSLTGIAIAAVGRTQLVDPRRAA